MHAPAMRMAPSGPARGPVMQGGQALAVAEGTLQVFVTFDQVVELIREKRDMKLLYEVEQGLRLDWGPLLLRQAACVVAWVAWLSCTLALAPLSSAT